MKIGIVCYPTFGGSGVIATELGKALSKAGHCIHFITYTQPTRLDFFNENIFYHEVDISGYPLFKYPPYELALASKIVDVLNMKSWTCCMFIMQSLMHQLPLWPSRY